MWTQFFNGRLYPGSLQLFMAGELDEEENSSAEDEHALINGARDRDGDVEMKEGRAVPTVQSQWYLGEGCHYL